MNELAKKGRYQTLILSFSIILISMFSIAFSNLLADSADPKKVFQQVIRFIPTLALIYFLFQGKNWARITLIILSVLASLISLGSLFLPVPFLTKSPFVVMLFIYSLGVYHLYFSKSFKAYFHYLTLKK